MTQRLDSLGLPFHLWSRDNFILIGREYGEVLEVDMESVKLRNLNVNRVQIMTEVTRINFDLITVTGKVKGYKIVALPVIEQVDLKIKEDIGTNAAFTGETSGSDDGKKMIYGGKTWCQQSI